MERDITVHTVFGSMFGEAVQQLLCGKSLQEAVLAGMMLWTLDLEDFEKEKSFWYCIAALEKFAAIKHTTVLADYDVAYINGKPACELSLCIILPGGFYYRGFVDIVLVHRITGQYLVVDIKTSNRKFSHEAKYINSPQALGYSIIMDYIAPGQNTFEVMYYEYLTPIKKFVDMTFTIGYLQRAQWLRNLLVDIQIMEMYDQYEEWPMHGESCYGFKACSLIDVCTMTTNSLCGTARSTVDAITLDRLALADYDVVVRFEDLVANQLERV